LTGHDLLHAQLTLSRIGLDAEGCLVRLPGPYPEGIPRFYSGQLNEGAVTYYRHDLPRPIRDQLAALPLQQAREDHSTVCAILSQHAPCQGVWDGASYVVSRPIADAEHPDVRCLDPRIAAERELLMQFSQEVTAYGWPAFGVVVDGCVAAVCVSSREDACAGEAWVQTTPALRRQGYARQATAAWAQALQRAGKIAFYSHSADNPASAGVARSLGLTLYLRDIGYL
jgi:GNAT superfamily N-acetyltransferase